MHHLRGMVPWRASHPRRLTSLSPLQVTEAQAHDPNDLICSKCLLVKMDFLLPYLRAGIAQLSGPLVSPSQLSNAAFQPPLTVPSPLPAPVVPAKRERPVECLLNLPVQAAKRPKSDALPDTQLVCPNAAHALAVPAAPTVADGKDLPTTPNAQALATPSSAPANGRTHDVHAEAADRDKEVRAVPAAPKDCGTPAQETTPASRQPTAEPAQAQPKDAPEKPSGGKCTRPRNDTSGETVLNDVLLPFKWREEICRCAECMTMYRERGVEHIFEDRDCSVQQLL